MNFARLVEAVYLGWIGTEALAALGFAFPVTITLFAFAGGIGTCLLYTSPSPRD